MKTPNSSPAYTARQRRPADLPWSYVTNVTNAAATARAAAVEATAVDAAVEAAVEANAGWTAEKAGKWLNAALASYDAANAVYRNAYGCTVDHYASASQASYKALDIIAAKK